MSPWISTDRKYHCILAFVRHTFFCCCSQKMIKKQVYVTSPLVCGREKDCWIGGSQRRRGAAEQMWDSDVEKRSRIRRKKNTERREGKMNWRTYKLFTTSCGWIAFWSRKAKAIGTSFLARRLKHSCSTHICIKGLLVSFTYIYIWCVILLNSTQSGQSQKHWLLALLGFCLN